MKRYLMISGCMIIFFLILFLIVEYLDIGFLKDPITIMRSSNGLATALIGIVLIISDIFLPIPNSIIMVFNGLFFGTILGTIISLIGLMGFASLGFYLGRKSRKLIKTIASEKEYNDANNFLQKYGLIAIILSRPIPLLSETIIIVAGSSEIAYSNAIVAAFLGYLVPALLYSATGQIAASFQNLSIVWIFSIFVISIIWIYNLRYRNSLK